MEIAKALEIDSALADGVDPFTGEVLPMESPYQHPDTVRALHEAIRALESAGLPKKRKEALPERTGAPWTEDEERQLVTNWKAGTGVAELAAQHQRTRGAIDSRLAKLGLI